MSLKIIKPLTKSGFSIQSMTPDNSDGATTEFNTPAQVIINAPFGDKGAAQYLELYSSPSRPGFSNHVGRMVVVKDTTGEMPKMLKKFTAPIPIWLNHIITSSFFNQDALFLYAEERSLAHNKEYRASDPNVTGDNYASLFFLFRLTREIYILGPGCDLLPEETLRPKATQQCLQQIPKLCSMYTMLTQNIARIVK